MALTANVLAHQFHQSPSWFLLPFLYQTRTLSSVRRSKTRRKQHGPYRSFSTTGNTLAGLEERRHPYALHFGQPAALKRRKDKDPIPFERSGPSEDEDIAHERNILLPRPSPNSTITASEQAVFDRIFADIASSKRTTLENALEEEDEVTADSFKDLNTIFNEAIEELQTRTEKEQRKSNAGEILTWTPIVQDIPTLSSYSTELLDKAGWGKPGRIGSEDVSDLAEAHRQHRTKIERMLQAAETDLEVWQVLEKEVFSLVHELNARIEATEKGKKKRKGRGSRNYASSTEEEALFMTPASLPPTVLLSILQTEYPQYLADISRLLRNSFPSSPYALNILPAVRRLGPVSYVLGASTALFNETLLLLWNQESNLHAMADLLDEMDKQGVESNEITIKFLKGLKRVRNTELRGENGAWRRMWWQIADIEKGWQRLATAFLRCVEEANLREKETVQDVGDPIEE